MWNHLSTISQSVSQITKVVGAQLLDSVEERIDADDFSDGDTTECSPNESPVEMSTKISRLQDKLSRARDEIDRINDFRTRAQESMAKSMADKDEEISELQSLLEEARLLAVESAARSPSLSPSSQPRPTDDMDTATGPIIQHKIRSSERVDALTRKMHAEKRNHMASLSSLQEETAQLKGDLCKMQRRLDEKEHTIGTLRSEVEVKTQDAAALKMAMERLRCKQQQNESPSELTALRNKSNEQAQLIQELRGQLESMNAKSNTLQGEVDRERGLVQELSSNRMDRDHILAAFEDEKKARIELESQLNTCTDKLKASESDAVELIERTNELSEELTKANATVVELQDEIAKLNEELDRSPSDDASGGDMVPRAKMDQLRDQAKQRVAHLQDQINGFKTKYDRLSAETQSQINKLSDELRASTSSHADFTDSVRSLLEAIEAELKVEEPILDKPLDHVAVLIIQALQSASAAPNPNLTDSLLQRVLAQLVELLTIEIEDADNLPLAAEYVVRAVSDRIEKADIATSEAKALEAECKESQDFCKDLSQKLTTAKSLYSTVVDQYHTAHANEQRASDEVASLRTENGLLKGKLVDLQKKHDRSASSLSKLSTLESELQLVENDNHDKAVVIKELKSQIAEHIKKILELERRQEEWLSEAQRDLSDMELERSKFSERIASVEADRDQRLSNMHEQMRKEKEAIRQSQLDLQAARNLASDYASLQSQLTAKTEECNNLSEALDNLQIVLDQYRSEMQEKKEESRQQLNDSREAVEVGRLAIEELTNITQALRESEASVVQLEDRLRSTRKYAHQVETDNTTLRHAIQQTMDRIKNFSSDENLVDRRLVNKLIVTFLEKKASNEVLNLMLKMLGFTDEQKRLVIESQRPRSLLGSFTSMIPRPYSMEEDEPEDDSTGELNLADQWINFLLKETGSRRVSRSGSSLSSPVAANTALSSETDRSDKDPDEPVITTSS